MRSRIDTKRTIALLSAGFVAWAVIACTHDFDAYETGSGTPTTPGQRDGSSEGSTTIPGTDGATTPPKDAATPPGDGASGACAAVAACGTTEGTCVGTCDQTAVTCDTACGANNGCKKGCKDTHDACRAQCKSDCLACAGAACTSLCP